MGTIVHGGYSTPLEAMFGEKYEPKGSALRFGTEVETGWHTRDTRDAFLVALEEANLADQLVSKNDSSIEGDYPSELVSLPLVPAESRTLMENLGGIMEQFADRGMNLGNCGVHVHVTKSALTEPVLWRMVQAIRQDATYIGYWATQGKSRTDDDEIERDGAVSRHIHKFWNLIALRSPTSYSKRGATDSLRNFLSSGSSHSHAVTKGSHTPTIEFRIFRTARQKTVLTSYVEVIRELNMFAVECVKKDKFAAPDWKDSSESRNIGGWESGAFPVNAFAAWVMEHSEMFPALCRRLALDKFAEFLGEPRLDTYTEASHVSLPHDDLRLGCRVQNDINTSPAPVFVVTVIPRQQDYVITSQLSLKGERAGLTSSEQHELYYTHLIHACPGATTKGLFE